MARTGFERNVERLASALAGASLDERLRLVAAAARRPVLTTSFGLEDQALTHAVTAASLPVRIVTIDTGRLFPETYELWAKTEERYGLRIEAFAPEAARVERLVARQGVNGFRRSVEARQACCYDRKVEPLGRALAGADIWITGLRAGQSTNRAATPLAALDPERRLIKANPLADWSRDDVAAYVAAHDVPVSPLHARGFLSVGCAPCTRAVRPGEPERAGRWWWEAESRKECGLHLAADGRLVRATEPA
jgi:phosphoadenosine phosphosulfate reductase